MGATEIEFGGGDPAKLRASFVAVTALARIYEDYDDRAVRSCRPHALVLMVHRWDGRIGFPGGLAVPGCDPRDEAVRELAEEVGLEARPEDLRPIATHDTPNLVVDLWRLDKGIVTNHYARHVLAAAALAPHALSEGCAVWAHLETYSGGRGLPTLAGCNTLATAVVEELACLRKAMGLAPG